MYKKQTYVLLSFFLVLIITACANIGTPDGGLYDETPPKIVHTSPKYGSTESKAKKIVLTFDENIQLSNVSEKVVVSPPQKESPEISYLGKKVTVTLYDTLQEQTTYTIDFSDAIQDYNEGNPMGDYAFTFSTGENIDTMQVSGNVLDASNLEPIKGIMVGLYYMGTDSLPQELPNDVFTTKPFERISRTDSRGHFVIKGIAPGNYRVYALKDQNENYYFDQKSEMIAFSDRKITPSFKPDVRQDTVWHDSIHYDSIVDVHYTHFFPDDIVLLAFTETSQTRYLLKSERPVLNKFTLYFTSGSDTLPKITGLNFNSDNAFVIENSERNDTITYWIRDSLIYNIDTLELNLDFYATDTLGMLSLQREPLYLVSRLTKERMAKDKEKAYEEWAKEYRENVKRERKQKEKEEKERLQREKEEREKAEKEGLTLPDVPAVEKPKGDEVLDSVDVVKDSVQTVVQNGVDSLATTLPDTLSTVVSSVNDSIVVSDSIVADINDISDVEEDSDEDELAEESVSEDDVAKNDDKDDDSKSKKKKKKKKKRSKDDDIVVPPMPEELMQFKFGNVSSLSPDKNVDFTVPEPIDTIDMSKIHFYLKVDSVLTQERFILKRIDGKLMSYRIYAEWQPDSTYVLQLDSAAFVNIYGKASSAVKKEIKVRSLDSFTTLFVNLQGVDSTAVVELLNSGDNVVARRKAPKGRAEFYFINPGTYYMRMFLDKNGNGKWDTGIYEENLQAEPVYYYPRGMELRAQWEITQTWNPLTTPIPNQKPEKITKQKADKEKTIKNRNAEKLSKKKK